MYTSGCDINRRCAMMVSITLKCFQLCTMHPFTYSLRVENSFKHEDIDIIFVNKYIDVCFSEMHTYNRPMRFITVIEVPIAIPR